MNTFLRGVGMLLGSILIGAAANSGDQVVLLFNKNSADSRKVAEHYAAKRGVPEAQLFGVDVEASAESITRADFRSRIERPVFDWLVDKKLLTLNSAPRPTPPNPDYRPIAEARVRYLVLCYGLPLKVTRDAAILETNVSLPQEILRGRNEAAVDAELALLPVSREGRPLTGPMGNPFYGTTNAALFHPTNGLLLVTRLDGPTPEIARGLVDKALDAEANGLWGRAYIDSRGLNEGEYKQGDDWMRISAEITRRQGFQTTLDAKDTLFPETLPLSHTAFYVGWYESKVSGALAGPNLEFMPGAFAYHLHSYSAMTLHSATQAWVGPLLARGATISMGCVEEPYLAGTPNVALFLERLIYSRFNFAEAAYAAQSALSWQTTVVGDPLYRPFGTPPEVLHARLEREKNPLVAWSHLRVVGLNEASGARPEEAMQYLESQPVTKESAVLTEKVGDLYVAQKKLSAAAESYAEALKLKPSPAQKLRLLLTVGDLHKLLGREKEAFEAYERLVMDFPGNANLPFAYQQLAALARKLGRTEEAEKYSKLAGSTGR